MKAQEPYFFPYKEELSVGKMEFTAAGDNDLHLMETSGMPWGFISRRDIGFSDLYGS